MTVPPREKSTDPGASARVHGTVKRPGNCAAGAASGKEERRAVKAAPGRALMGEALLTWKMMGVLETVTAGEVPRETAMRLPVTQ
jgi:hypothetical protein